MASDAASKRFRTAFLKGGLAAIGLISGTIFQTAAAQTPSPMPLAASEPAAESTEKNKARLDIETENQGVYVALRGYSAIEDENNLIFDNSREIAGAVGYRFNPRWRLELEYANRHSDIVGLNGASNTRGESNVDTVGIHLFYDFRKGKKIRPFLGAGAGFLSRDVTFVGTADNDPDFVVSADDHYADTYANFFAGSSYFLTDNFRLATGFEYVTGRDRNIRANFRDLPGINRSYNFFIGGRWFFTN